MRTLVAALALTCACGKTGPPPLHWEHDLDRGLARAKAEHRPAIVFFGASWDAAAKELHYATFADPHVRDDLASFVTIYVDCTDDEDRRAQDAEQRFRVVGTPTILFLASDATELGRLTEFVPPSGFRAALRWAATADQRSTQPVSVIVRPMPH